MQVAWDALILGSNTFQFNERVDAAAKNPGLIGGTG
jgi:hypothetical protein